MPRLKRTDAEKHLHGLCHFSAYTFHSIGRMPEHTVDLCKNPTAPLNIVRGWRGDGLTIICCTDCLYEQVSESLFEEGDLVRVGKSTWQVKQYTRG